MTFLSKKMGLVEVENFCLFIFMKKPERIHIHFAAIAGRCTVQAADKRPDRIDRAACFNQIRARIAAGLTQLYRIFFEKRFDAFIFYRRSGWHAKVLAASMASLGALEVRNQAVKILYLH